jgi:hypothetical protein
MGRKWDNAAAELGFAPPLPPRSKEHLRELQSEFAFQRYWGERFGMMYDQSEDDAVAFVWALPRTAHLTQTALRWAGWRILDSWHHVFGQGWNKNGGHLKPAHEVWFVALKGKPELSIDAGRVERGERDVSGWSKSGSKASANLSLSGGNTTRAPKPDNALGSHPPNFALSHHPACVRIGERKVKGGVSVNRNRDDSAFKNTVTHSSMRISTRDVTYTDNGTESLPAYSCAVSCPCGRHWIQPSGGSPSQCECGRMGEWVCPVAELDEQSGHLQSGTIAPHHVSKGSNNLSLSGPNMPRTGKASIGDSGGASRFFPSFGYYAKASGRVDEEGIPRGERHAGCEALYWRANKQNPFGFDRVTREEWEGLVETKSELDQYKSQSKNAKARGNVHPTVKGIEQLMYLIRLSGGDKIGDLCFGSGGTAIASNILGLDYEGAELCPEAVEITRARLAFWSGLPLQALETFKLSGEMPEVKPIDSRQRSLFGEQ